MIYDQLAPSRCQGSGVEAQVIGETRHRTEEQAQKAEPSTAAPRRRARDFVLDPLLPLAYGFLVRLPKWAVALLGSLGGWLYRSFGGRERRILRRNLRRVLAIDPTSAEGRKIEREVFRHQVVAAIETAQGIERPERVVIEGLGLLREQFRRAEEAGHGQLLITAHLGSWELIGMYVAESIDGSFYELAKPSRIPAASRLLEHLRHRAGTKVLWTGRRRLLREMLEVLRAGDTLGFAMDQKPDRLIGPVVDFFGHPTEFVAGPASLAVRTDAAVLAVFCSREAPFSYRLWTEEVLPAGHGERDEDALTQRFAQVIEEAVRRHPAQWPWNYRRWIFPDDPWDAPRGRASRRRKNTGGDATTDSP